MARSYANIVTAIWQDTEFRKLIPEDQQGFLLVITQPNISAAGMLPLTLRRWAGMSSGTTVADVRARLERLQGARFLLIDEETEEVLVRTFVVHDKGYSNPKRRPAILDAGRDIVSVRLRLALAAEFERVGLPIDGLGVTPPNPDGPSTGRPIDCLSDSLSIGNSPGPDSDNQVEAEDHHEPDNAPEPDVSTVDNVFPQADSLSIAYGRPTDCLSGSERSVVTLGPYIGVIPNPQSSSLTPEPRPPHGSLAQFVAESTGADEDETTAIIDRVKRDHRPRNLGPYVRTMASNGDLGPILDDIREQRRRADLAAQRRAAAAAAWVPFEPPRSVTPEEGDAAREHIHAVLAGIAKRKRGGDPVPLAAVLDEARTA